MHKTQFYSENRYKKLVVSRPIQPMGKDIGYLPGTMEEKMRPWISPIQDNLEFLMSDRTGLEMMLEQGKIEVEALTYIRGRSIGNSFIIIDEAQNLSTHELKTIIKNTYSSNLYTYNNYLLPTFKRL